MEISSEHDHNGGDEDIDIDIDLTAGQVDEDYVLEDAISNTGLEDDLHHHQSSAIGDEDLMIDEGDEGYTVDNLSLIPDPENQNMDAESPTMSFAVVNDSNNQLGDDEALDVSHYIDEPGKEAENIWGSQEALDHVPFQSNEPLQDPEGSLNVESGNLPVELEKPDLNSPRPDVLQEASQTSFLTDPTPEASKHLKSPPATVPGTPDRESVIPIPNANAASVVPEDTEKASEIISEDASNEVFAGLDIIITYQNSEYTLFSTSESDDPDSYFLSDLSIAEQPLVDFFKAIRDVIHEDLTDEDELCLSFDQLMLELEEVSCTCLPFPVSKLTANLQTSTIQAITLKQISDLHEKLLQNDGIESPRPIYATLTTRSNFSIRFANLTAGAAEGKGLSELVTWDEHSESFDEPVEAQDIQQSDELNEDARAEDEGSTTIKAEALDHSISEYSPNEAESAVNQARVSDPRDAPESNPTNLLPENPNPSILAGAQAVETHPQIPTTVTVNSGEYDEDGDIIDYSDEEIEAPRSMRKDAVSQPSKLETDNSRTKNGTSPDFFSPCLKPSTCFCSKCSDLLLAEYEAVNEELRRRSMSRANEDGQVEQAAAPAKVTEDDSVEQGSEFDFADEVGYDDETYEEPLGYDDVGQTHNNYSAENKTGHASEVVVDKFEEPPLDGVLIDDAAAEGSMAAADCVNSQDQDQADEKRQAAENGFRTFPVEIDFAKEDEPQFRESSSSYNDEAGSQSDHEKNLAASKLSPKEDKPNGSSFKHGDVIDSESVESEKTLEAQSTLDLEDEDEDEDEIDYDDDDDPKQTDVPPKTTLETEALPIPPTGSGKRARIDGDSDEGVSTRSKGSNLPRKVRRRIC